MICSPPEPKLEKLHYKNIINKVISIFCSIVKSCIIVYVSKLLLICFFTIWSFLVSFSFVSSFQKQVLIHLIENKIADNRGAIQLRQNHSVAVNLFYLRLEINSYDCDVTGVILEQMKLVC